MDRSFLSDERVIEASRNFVCLRLATYEDAEEAKFLKRVFARNGRLENTVFAILSPDAKRSLARTGRGPTFRNAIQMASSMNQIIRTDYSSASQATWSKAPLPEMKNLDLGLNVAACDSLPLIVLVAETDKELQVQREKARSIAWSQEFSGQFIFASARTTDNLNALHDLNPSHPAGIYFVKPDTFGMSGQVSATLADSTNSINETLLRESLAQFEPPAKDHRQHVQLGFKSGLKWETAIPVTDQGASQAAKRLWGETN